MPDELPAENVADANPLRVGTSAGLTLPSVVLNRTVVPSWTGAPLSLTTNALSSVVPPRTTIRLFAVKVMDELEGAKVGT